MASGLKTDDSSASLGLIAAAKRFVKLLFRAGPTTTSPTPDPETAARWAARLSRARPPEPHDPGLAPRREIIAGLETAPRPHPTHIYTRYVEGLRSELQAQGLPTRADGVRIMVVGEPPRQVAVGEPPRRTGGLADHTVEIARTISGPVGLAPGAVIDVLLDGNHDDSLSANIHGSRLSQLAPVAEALVLNVLAKRRREIDAVVSRAPADGRTTLASISNGTSLISVANRLAQVALNAPRGSTMYAELCAALGHAPRVGNDADRDLIAEHLVPSLHRARLASPAVRAALGQLDAAVVAARKRGVLVLKSAGNEQREPYALKDPRVAMQFDAVPSMMVVGAIDLGKHPTDSQDDTIAEFSVMGPALHSVGVKVPVGDKGDVRRHFIFHSLRRVGAGADAQSQPTPDA